jgi:Uncharacterised nucleotidyltransferase
MPASTSSRLTVPGVSRTRLFPTASQEALLRAALLPVPEALAAWRSTAAGLDPRRMDPGSRRLLPLVWANLTGQGVRDAQVDGLAPIYEETRTRTESLLARAGPVLEALHRAGMRTLVLKGAALVGGYYRDAGTRPMSDLDVLVPTVAATTGAQTLEAHGWVPRFPWDPRAVRLTHSAVFDDAAQLCVDLHWHVFAECCRPDDDEILWARSIAIEIGGVRTRALAPADQLLHVCIHGEKWVHVPGIRWVADAVQVIRSGAVVWPHLVAEAVRRRFVGRLTRQLTYLRDGFAAPIPGDVLATLAAMPISTLERLEQALGVRERRASSSLLAHWFTHARSARAGLAGAAVSFPRYLQAIWHLDGLRDVPAAALSRVIGRLRQ